MSGTAAGRRVVASVKPSVWILVIGLAGGYGDSIATAPKLFATQGDCGAAGQAWLDKVSTLPSFDPWDSKWPAKFPCFQVPNNDRGRRLEPSPRGFPQFFRFYS